MIQVEGLTKTFRDKARGDRAVVDRISFEVRDGEIFGLLGPNGAGKTTTLRMLATLLKPSAGRALVDGHDVTVEPAEVRRRIGFLSGDTGLYHRLTPARPCAFSGGSTAWRKAICVTASMKSSPC